MHTSRIGFVTIMAIATPLLATGCLEGGSGVGGSGTGSSESNFSEGFSVSSGSGSSSGATSQGIPEAATVHGSEPASLVFLGGGLAWTAWRRRRKTARKV
ncbi:MAG: PEP-CTERM sorting domain-containing protein [Nitrososphaera sp.]|nr:PEP-CTERM sorting domain-containing protein [Nitrososphaera sp.]